jgi:hypothetical protein
MSRLVDDGAITASPWCTVRIAVSSSSGCASLSRNPLAPARMASSTYSSRSNVVSTTTRGSPAAAAAPSARSARVADRPSIPGMRTSISTTSVLVVASRCSASRPSSASTTTWRSGWESMTMRRPARTSGWSSTSATRTGPAVSSGA